jgi:cellulose synthase/poly-beta-1,6-N-acetylglucosamine synthase-like glycosyltransferase
LAFRLEVLRDLGLLGQWERSLWEDTAIYRPLQKAGLRVHFIPNATMVTQESTDLMSCFRFISRQLLNVRLYHPSWPAILAHALASEMGMALAVGTCAVSLATGRWQIAAWTGGFVMAFVLGLGISLALIERRIPRLVKRVGQSRLLLPANIWLAIPVTQCFYIACLASAAVMSKVVWRGITYQIQSPWGIRMVTYRPYAAPEESSNRTASLV